MGYDMNLKNHGKNGKPCPRETENDDEKSLNEGKIFFWFPNCCCFFNMFIFCILDEKTVDDDQKVFVDDNDQQVEGNFITLFICWCSKLFIIMHHCSL